MIAVGKADGGGCAGEAVTGEDGLSAQINLTPAPRRLLPTVWPPRRD
jgi:hypothetical protein